MIRKLNPSLLGAALLAAALLAALAHLVAQTRRVDFDAQTEIVGTLRELKQADTEWAMDVFRVKTGLVSNYDRVASGLPRVQQLQKQLTQQTDAFWQVHRSTDSRLPALLATYSQLMTRKTTLIEQFKSQNSVLNNSSRYLPQAATDLLNAARAAEVPRGQQSDIEQTMNRLLADTLNHVQTPSDSLRSRISTANDDLLRQTADLAEPVREQARTLAAHVDTVLKLEDSVPTLLGTLSALPTGKAIDDLSAAQQHEFDALLQSQQTYRLALTVYAVFLLALLAAAGWWLYRSYRLLRDTNAALQKANQEIKQSQAYLVQAEKMSALGQMVAGIAHEINTPLAYVKGTFAVLSEQLKLVRKVVAQSQRFTHGFQPPRSDNATLNLELRQLAQATQRVVDEGTLDEADQLLNDGMHGMGQIADIIVNLRNFSRLDRAKVSQFSVQSCVESTLMLANTLLKDHIKVHTLFEPNVPQVMGSPSQINQVLLNLITNAVHAMPERSTPKVITLRTALENPDTVRIEVQDNGHGIPKDVLPKIFDPFFTTKAVGHGTGMGLSISYKIIQEHGGKIWADSEDDVGTVFTILLPVRQAAAPPAEAVFLSDNESLLSV